MNYNPKVQLVDYNLAVARFAIHEQLETTLIVEASDSCQV